MDKYIILTLDDINLTSIKKNTKPNDYAIYTTKKYDTHIQFTRKEITFEADNIDNLEKVLEHTKITILNENEDNSKIETESRSLLDYLLIFRTLSYIDSIIDISDNIRIKIIELGSINNKISSSNPIILSPNYKLKLQKRVVLTLYYTYQSSYEFYIQSLYKTDKPWKLNDKSVIGK